MTARAQFKGGRGPQVGALVVFSTLSAKEALLELVPRFERETGQEVDMTCAGGSVLAARLAGDTDGDLFIGPDEFTEKLIEKGILRRGDSKDIAISSTGLALAASAPTPDIGTAEKLKALLLAARGVSYSPGASGIYFVELLRRFGLAEIVAGKVVTPQAGELVGSVIARGAADVGIQQMSELLPVSGIQILELPSEFRQTIAYKATSFAGTKRDSAAAEFVNFLRSPAVNDVWRRKGLQPC